ncbi:MAG: type II secretion system protein GspL [Desulfobacterales bacterium]|nr:type II secretion system protein GspL [Desulfobacterales bacterium]
MSKKILGIDFRPRAVSAVLIRSSLRRSTIEAYAYAPVTEEKEGREAMAAALDKITQRIDTRDAVCVAALPAGQISFRNMVIPFHERKKIKQILPFELEQTLPFATEDLITDFAQIHVGPAPHPPLFTASVEKATLDFYLDALAQFRINPEIITIGGYCTARILGDLSGMKGNWLFLDMEDSRSTVFLVASGQICLVRSFPLPATAAPMKEVLGTHIRQTLYAFEENLHQNFSPEMIFVSGCGLVEENFENEMGRIIETPVKRVDLSRQASIQTVMDPAQAWEPAQLDNALALALIKHEGIDIIDFQRENFSAETYWLKYKKEFSTTAVLAGLVLALAFIYGFYSMRATEKKVARLNYQITDIFKTVFPGPQQMPDPVRQLGKKIKDIKNSAMFQEEPDKKILTIDILRNISDNIPKEVDVAITNLVAGPEGVLISGDTDTFNSVDEMKNRLESKDLFAKVTITSANMDRNINRVQFKMKIQL